MIKVRWDDGKEVKIYKSHERELIPGKGAEGDSLQEGECRVLASKSENSWRSAVHDSTTF